MPSAKEIKSSMRGIRDTMKITKAMYMISTIKMRKAKHQLEATEPYFYGLQEAMSSILYNFPSIKSRYFGESADTEEDSPKSEEGSGLKKKGYIVLSSDRGLAGAYNQNVFKVVESLVEDMSEDEYELMVVGDLGLHTLTGRGYNVNQEFHYTATEPSLERARLISENLIQDFYEGKYDELHVIYTRMINSMETTVETQQLLPLKKTDFIDMENEKVPKHLRSADSGKLGAKEGDAQEYLIEPSPQVVLEEIVRNYVIGYIYGTLVQATACEENSRMTAMKSATDNAKDMLNVLTVQYNRVRQAAITQQITEICSGARALEKSKNKS